jgi:hypothetical protein
VIERKRGKKMAKGGRFVRRPCRRFGEWSGRTRDVRNPNAWRNRKKLRERENEIAFFHSDLSRGNSEKEIILFLLFSMFNFNDKYSFVVTAKVTVKIENLFIC